MCSAKAAPACSITILRKAALAALAIPREKARAHALTFSWQASARQFVDNVQSAHAKDARYARRSWLRRRRVAAQPPNLMRLQR